MTTTTRLTSAIASVVVTFFVLHGVIGLSAQQQVVAPVQLAAVSAAASAH